MQERFHARLRLRIVLSDIHEHADAPHALALLRARGERPRGRAAEQRDEVAAPHSMTSSAQASTTCPLQISLRRSGTLERLHDHGQVLAGVIIVVEAVGGFVRIEAVTRTIADLLLDCTVQKAPT